MDKERERNYYYVSLIKALAVAMVFLLGPLYVSGVSTYSVHNQDTLRIGNDQVEFMFVLQNENIALYHLHNKTSRLIVENNQKLAIVRFGEETTNLISYEGPYSIPGKGRTGLIPEETSYVFHYENLSLRMVLSIWPDVKALEIKYFLLARNSDASFQADETRLCAFGYPQTHITYTTIEFKDQTDRFNNLVHKQEALGFTHPALLRGNILEMKNQVAGYMHWVLKKSPCSHVQLHDPGYDFAVSSKGFEVVGAGLLPSDMNMGEWIPAYGMVIGAPVASEIQMRMDMRTYLKNSHLSDPQDLEMVMMNTWGDRNKDASIGETFIKQEIDAAHRLGITHFQIDDGWQRGKSMNSADTTGRLWEAWTYDDWQPDTERFPNGLDVVAAYARQHNVQLGLWFNPSRTNNYASWATDADIVIRLFNDFGIRFFKIDGIDLPTKLAEMNLRSFYEKVQAETGNAIIFNIDATAGRRGGYFFLNDYGNIFLENRYTDWANYYPYQTLRNLWMLSAYVPPEKLQIEFLNIWRNPERYDLQDPFRPQNVSFEYAFAITMMAQPLAWFEGSGLPAEAISLQPVISKYTSIQYDLHQGYIFPIGDEPSGQSWTGFQSLHEDRGYLLIFREANHHDRQAVKVHMLEGENVLLEPVTGAGQAFTAHVSHDGKIEFYLPEKNSYALYRYTLMHKND